MTNAYTLDFYVFISFWLEFTCWFVYRPQHFESFHHCIFIFDIKTKTACQQPNPRRCSMFSITCSQKMPGKRILETRKTVRRDIKIIWDKISKEIRKLPGFELSPVIEGRWCLLNMEVLNRSPHFPSVNSGKV